MTKFSAFRNRMNSKYGDGSPDDRMQGTEVTADRRIMTSRTRSEISRLEIKGHPNETFTLEEVEKRYCILSDIESFYKRLVWYRPKDLPRLGEYIQHKDKTYLTTLTKEVEYFPQAEIMYCDFDFPIKGKSTEIITGFNELNRPKKEYITTPDYTIPCSTRSPMFTVIDNSQMPLPVGAMYLYIAYHKDIDIPYNYKFEYRSGSYKVSSINESHLLEDKDTGELYGYLEIRCQREQKEGEKVDK